MNLRVLRGGNLWAGAFRLLLGVAEDVFGRFDWSTRMECDGACRSYKQGGDFPYLDVGGVLWSCWIQ